MGKICQQVFWSPISLELGHEIHATGTNSEGPIPSGLLKAIANQFPLPLLHLCFPSLNISYHLTCMLLSYCESIIPLENFLLLCAALFFSLIPVTSLNVIVPFHFGLQRHLTQCIGCPTLGFQDTTLCEFFLLFYSQPLLSQLCWLLLISFISKAWNSQDSVLRHFPISTSLAYLVISSSPLLLNSTNVSTNLKFMSTTQISPQNARLINLTDDFTSPLRDKYLTHKMSKIKFLIFSMKVSHLTVLSQSSSAPNFQLWGPDTLNWSLTPVFPHNTFNILIECYWLLSQNTLQHSPFLTSFMVTTLVQATLICPLSCGLQTVLCPFWI